MGKTEEADACAIDTDTDYLSIGKPLPRRDDERILRGGARYVGDLIARSTPLHVKILRSRHAHAWIRKIDITAALKMPGVRAVITEADARDIGTIPCDWIPPGMAEIPEQPVLARERVRYVGQPIAAVAALTAQQASNALDAIVVQFDVLQAIVDQEKACADGSVRLHDAVPENIAYRYKLAGGDTSKAFAGADVTFKRRLIHSRVSPAPLEGRAVLSEYDAISGELRHCSSSQRPHFHAEALAGCLGLPFNKVQFIVPDVGGAFGSKLAFYSEDVLCAMLSMRTKNPCAWIEGRAESFLGTTHGRDQIQYVELAANNDGVISGLRCKVFADLGAYAMGMGPGVPAINTACSITGPYRISNAEVEIIGVYTNRMPTGPYRGAGHPEATFMIERAIDELAAKLSIDPALVRRRNYVSPEEMPFELLGGLQLDSGQYSRNLDAVLLLSKYDELRKWQVASRLNGRVVGVGLITFSENSGVGPSAGTKASGFRHAGHESARVTVNSDGTVVVFSGAQDSGQGHRTALAQIAADTLQISVEKIAVLQGDSRNIPYGTGSFNSRTMAIGGTAVLHACQQLLEKAKRFAAHRLGCLPGELTFHHGAFHCADESGDHKVLSFTDSAHAAHFGRNLPDDLTSGLDETSFFEPKGMPASYGSAVAVVEIDPSTGHISLLKFAMVDDSGTVINPLLVDGQVHGGATQGIGQALMESMAYNALGESLIAGFDDYAMPRAADLPDFICGHTEVPSPLNPLGAKGAGEGATVAATAAVSNAVLDAVRPYGLFDVPMPMTPMAVWRMLTGTDPQSRTTAGKS